jgi:Cu2+-exporting ATPase
MERDLQHYFETVSMLLTVPTVFFSAAPFYRSAGRALRGGSLNMDLPVSLAILAAFLASVVNTLRGQGAVYFDSVAMFIFLLSAGRYIEMRVRHRAMATEDALARLLPTQVTRIGSEGRAEAIALEALRRGDEIRVEAGQVIAADGLLLSSSGLCDESLLTGESGAVRRRSGEPVIAGARNIGGSFCVRVTAVGTQTTLMCILRMAEMARQCRPRMTLAADRAAGLFVGATLALAAGAGLIWLWADPTRAFDAVLSVLVVTCPCALSLAMPAAIAASTRGLARRGVIITRGDVLEALASADTVVFDKTGTLTEGRPSIVDFQAYRVGVSVDRAKALAALLEKDSVHPLAGAFRDCAVADCEVTGRRDVAGSGVEAWLSGVLHRIGSSAFVGEIAGGSPPLENRKKPDVFLGNEQGWLAGFVVRDALRPSAFVVVANLQEDGKRVEILSGDHDTKVMAAARELGVRVFRAGASPADKLEHVRRLEAEGRHVLVVGDGINDAAVMQAASVSIAMGGGAPLAAANAGGILLGESLAPLSFALGLSRRTVRVIQQNLYWAVAYNLGAVPLAAFGLLPPWLAAAGMSASSLLVIANAARLAGAPR